MSILIAAALALGPVAQVTGPEAAAESGQRVMEVDAPRLFEIAAGAEQAGRLDDAETIYRAMIADPDAEIRTEARFRLGMMLSRAGRPRDAAVLFREILDEKPESQRVRLELARVLVEIGDEGAARREVRQAQAGALPPEVSQLVDQFARALRSRKPIGASLELALVPDSNINRATDAKTLDTILAPLELSEDAREQSGIGLRAGAQAFVRIPLSPTVSIVPRISGQGEFYRQHQFDDLSASGLIGVEWAGRRGDRVQISAGGTYRWYGFDPYATTVTANVDWQHPLSRRSQLTVSGAVARSDYRTNDLQDGMLLSGQVGVEHAFSNRAGGGLTLSGVRQTATDPGYANVSAGISVLGWRDVGRTGVFASGSARLLEADERLFLYPRRRSDRLMALTVGATFRGLQYRRFAPFVRMSLERNFSTIGIYDYRRLAASFGVSRAF